MSSTAGYGSSVTRERILRSTFDLLPALGPDLRVADVASAADVSRQAVYLHFGSRAGLLLALAEWADRTFGLGELMDRVRDAPSGREALVRMIEAHATHNPQIDPMVRVVEAHRDRDPALSAVFDDRMRWRRAAHRKIVARLAAEGDLADGWTVEAATDLLFAITLNHTWRELTVHRGWSTRRYVRHMSLMATRSFTRATSPTLP